MDFVSSQILIPLYLGYLLDLAFRDPEWLPHPVVWLGRFIAWGESKFAPLSRKGRFRAGIFFQVFTLALVVGGFALVQHYLIRLTPLLSMVFASVFVYLSLAGNGLIYEAKQVFKAVDSSIEAGRKQLARIVGRDTAKLNKQEVRTAALESLSENLSDAVIAPLFYYTLFGLPGLVGYKVINTFDSMWGYKSFTHFHLGFWSAKVDDFANYIPARITAFLMVLVSGKFSALAFVKKYGRAHSSPNSAYPESALAGILNCKFGGDSYYKEKLVHKPSIGENDRPITNQDIQVATAINRRTELVMLLLVSMRYVLF